MRFFATMTKMMGNEKNANRSNTNYLKLLQCIISFLGGQYYCNPSLTDLWAVIGLTGIYSLLFLLNNLVQRYNIRFEWLKVNNKNY